MVISLKRYYLILIPKKCLFANIRLVKKSSLGRPEAQVLLVRSKSYYFEKRMKCRCMIISNSHTIQTSIPNSVLPDTSTFENQRENIRRTLMQCNSNSMAKGVQIKRTSNLFVNFNSINFKLS